MDLIRPATMRTGRNNRLLESLESVNSQTFSAEIALVDALSRTVQRCARRNRLPNNAVLNGLTTALVSCVQHMAPASEWADVSHVLADVIQRRLTVTGVT